MDDYHKFKHTHDIEEWLLYQLPNYVFITHNIMVPTPILVSSVTLTTYNNDLAYGSGNDNGSGIIGSGIAIESINISPSTKTNGLLPTFNSIVKFFWKLGKNY